MCLRALALGPRRRMGCPCRHPIGPTQDQGEGAQVCPRSQKRGSKCISSSACPELGSFCIVLSVGKICAFLLRSRMPTAASQGSNTGFPQMLPQASFTLTWLPQPLLGLLPSQGPARPPPCPQPGRVETARDCRGRPHKSGDPWQVREKKALHLLPQPAPGQEQETHSDTEARKPHTKKRL